MALTDWSWVYWDQQAIRSGGSDHISAVGMEDTHMMTQSREPRGRVTNSQNLQSSLGKAGGVGLDCPGQTCFEI
jgi:hypothetical protein